MWVILSIFLACGWFFVPWCWVSVALFLLSCFWYESVEKKASFLKVRGRNYIFCVGMQSSVEVDMGMVRMGGKTVRLCWPWLKHWASSELCFCSLELIHNHSQGDFQREEERRKLLLMDLLCFVVVFAFFWLLRAYLFWSKEGGNMKNTQNTPAISFISQNAPPCFR